MSISKSTELSLADIAKINNSLRLGKEYGLAQRIMAVDYSESGGVITQILRLEDDEPLKVGTGTEGSESTNYDATLAFDGTNVELLPRVDNACAFNVGDGTTDMDFKIFMGAATSHVLFDNSAAMAVFTKTGLSFSGAYTDDVLDFSEATVDPTGSGGPCFIRVGAYGTEVDYGADNHQSGVIRTYTTCSGDKTSYDRGIFACTVTTGAKAAFPVAGLAEANNTGTGPSALQAGQFIAHLGARSSGATLTTMVGSGAVGGMHGIWAKVAAASTSVCDSGSMVAPIWCDNQMSGTINGEEYGIFATTGASRPDAFIGFETTSRGYAQLLHFDSTFNSGAGTCVTTDSVPGTQDARMMVWYDGKQYYIPLYR